LPIANLPAFVYITIIIHKIHKKTAQPSTLITKKLESYM
jgi:hypothetical protein